MEIANATVLYTTLDGEADCVGTYCLLRPCPMDCVLVGSVVNSDDLHPWAKCAVSNLRLPWTDWS